VAVRSTPSRARGTTCLTSRTSSFRPTPTDPKNNIDNIGPRRHDCEFSGISGREAYISRWSGMSLDDRNGHACYGLLNSALAMFPTPSGFSLQELGVWRSDATIVGIQLSKAQHREEPLEPGSSALRKRCGYLNLELCACLGSSNSFSARGAVPPSHGVAAVAPRARGESYGCCAAPSLPHALPAASLGHATCPAPCCRAERRRRSYLRRQSRGIYTIQKPGSTTCEMSSSFRDKGRTAPAPG